MSTGTPSTKETPIEYLLGRLDGKMDLVIAKLDGHDKRISAVEKRQMYWAGASATIAVIATKLIPWTTFLR